MILISVFTIVALCVFLYLFWKRLKEDYLPSQIFTTAMYFLGGVLLGTWISLVFFREFWFWFCLILGFLGIYIGILRFRLKAYETVDAWIYAALPLVIFVFLYHFFKSGEVSGIIASTSVLGLFFLFLFLNNHYKKFAWYKSGKIGFSGFSVAGVFFLVRTIVAIIKPDMVSFVGRLDAIISGSIAFVCFLILFNLARRDE